MSESGARPDAAGDGAQQAPGAPPRNPWGEEEPGRRRFRFGKKQLGVLAGFVVNLGLSLLIAHGQGFRWGLPLRQNARYLSDGLFAVGLIVTSVGLLTWISSTGFFDIFSYAFRSLLVLFTPFVKPQGFPRYFDYKTMRAEKRKPAGHAVLLIGVALLGLSLAALLVYRG